LRVVGRLCYLGRYGRVEVTSSAWVDPVEPSGVQALKNPNLFLKDVEALAVLAVAVLVQFSYGVV